MAVPYTFGSATASIPLSQLDSNFATTITLGNTAIQLGNTVTTLNNMTLANVTVSSGNVIATNVTATNVTSPASTALTLKSAGTTAITVDTSQNVGIGTASPSVKLEVNGNIALPNATALQFKDSGGSRKDTLQLNSSSNIILQSPSASIFQINGSTEAMRIDSSGNLLVGKTSSSSAVVGVQLEPAGAVLATRTSDVSYIANRLSTDGSLFSFRQDSTEEGTISVSGTTVSYNGGHLSRWAQTTTAKDNSLVKGTVLSNLDAMNVYTDAEGNPVANEQLNKVKVSDVEGDANVAGVFVNWSYDEQHSVDEINMAMTGDMIIRIAQGVTVQRGDLLMSAGDGTAKTQGDDIVRSKTIAKVTSNHVTCTYADGSYCVPCVLMAC